MSESRVHGPSRAMLAACAATVSIWISAVADAANRLVPQQYSTIQAAINAAADGDTILVSPGSYLERINLGGKAVTVRSTGNASNTFLSSSGQPGAIISCVSGETSACLIEGFRIYGGGGPGVSVGWSSGPTIVGCVFTGIGGAGTALEISGNPTVLGCTITGNGGTGPAISIVSGSPTFRDCTITTNTCSSADGGAVSYVGNGGTVRFEDCLFSGNVATGRKGGAINATSNTGQLFLLRCGFVGNQSTGDGGGGGAIYAYGVSLSLEECTFSSNVVTANGGERRGGAIYTGSPLTAVDCVFQQNSVTVGSNGGSAGRAAFGGAISASAAVTLTDCVFAGNVTETPQGWCGYVGYYYYCYTSVSSGGALMCSSTAADVTISDCSFTSNVARNAVGSYLCDSRGGAIALSTGTRPTIRRCVFTSNAANPDGDMDSSGGTIWYESGAAGLVEDCTISGSVARTAGGAIRVGTNATPLVRRCEFLNCSVSRESSTGGAIRVENGSNMTLADCRFVNCSAGGAGGALYIRTSRVFVLGSNLEGNTAPNGSGIATEGSGLASIPNIAGNYFCGNSGGSDNWITGQWFDAGSNFFLATCGNDCNLNGIPDTQEIAAGASDCDADGVLDSCQIVSGDRNNDGVYDPCQTLAFEGLDVELRPIIGTHAGLPSTAVCWRVFARLSASSAGVTGIFGDPEDPLSIDAAGGFYQSPSGANVASDIPCTGGGPTVAYDSFLTIGGECANEVDVVVTGIDFTAFNADGGLSTSNGIAFVTPGTPASLAGKDGRVLLMQLTSRTGVKPTTSFNLIGDNADGTEWFAYGLPLPNPTLVDCNANGIHDVLDLNAGTSHDCSGNGVPDECEYPNANADCDADGTIDLCEIFSGAEADLNGNWIPDDCECLGDVTGDGAVNVYDVIAVIVAWGDPDPGAADLNGDGTADGVDLSLVLTGWGYCL